VGVEFGKGELVGGGVMHGNEHLAGLNNGGDEGAGGDAAAAGPNGELRAILDFEAAGVGGIDFDVDAIGIKAAKDSGFSSASLRVPLGGAAAAGEKCEWIFSVGEFAGGTWVVEIETSFAVWMEKAAVGEEAALLRGTPGSGGC